MTTVVHANLTSPWLPQTKTWLYNLVRFTPETITTHIACEYTENLDQFALPHIHPLYIKKKWSWQLLRLVSRLKLREQVRQMHLRRVIKRTEANIQHSHFGSAGWQNIGAARHTAVKHIVTFYGYDVNMLPSEDPVWLDRYKHLFQTASLVLCEGNYMRQSIIQLGCPADKVKVQHLGVDIDPIRFVPRSWDKREPLKILLAATFTEKKGFPYALEALGRLKNDVPLAITIIGDAPSASRFQREKRKMMAVVEKYQLQGQIRWLGYQPYEHLFEEAYQHHLFLSPSVTAEDGDSEGGAPVSLIDMSATGMPIVSTTHCDIPEVVVHGRAGLLAPERDIDTLVQHLTWFIDHPEKWAQMGTFARQHIEKEYNARIQGQRLAQIYTSLI